VPVRRTLETAVAPDADGVWRQREITSVARFRVRVVSDRSRTRPHQHGSGEEFEVVVDTNLDLWVRKFGTDAALRKDEDVAGVSFVVVDNVTMGIPHEISYPSRPASPLLRWACSCGAASKGWLEAEAAQRQGEEHRRSAIERDLAAAQLAHKRLAIRRDSE
jgi:hypothetical protein